MAGFDALLEESIDSGITVTAWPGDLQPSDPPAPQVASERYVVIDEIGRGKMGIVLRAYDPRLQREVALKTLGADQLSAEAQRQMLREAQAMAQLSHPNIVAVYDVSADRRGLFIAMEYVRGTTLKTFIAGAHAWQDIVRIFAAAGRGLAAAHAAGLLHRDFKPANVLVGEDGRVKVADFGLAHSSTSALFQTANDAELDEVVGTPRYMAPEQYEGVELDATADQYAFCVALWEALTGQPPFVASNFPTDLTAAAAQKRQGLLPWPRNSAVPPKIREAVARGLGAFPGDRWPTMDALVAVLEQYSEQRQGTWLIAASIVGALTISGVASASLLRAEDRCVGAQEKLAGVWDADRREAVERAFQATGAVYAGGVWDRVAPQLDEYARAWSTMHTEACESTTVRGEQPPDVMDLRMSCLHRAKIDLQAVTDLLANADEQVLERAPFVVESLPDLARCADVEALRAEVPPPEPALRDDVEAVVVRLAEIHALHEAGKYPETLKRILPVVEQAEAIPYAPLQTEVMVTLAFAWEASGAFPQAEAALKEAVRSALASKQWAYAAVAASRLVHIVGRQQMRPDEALAYAETAESLLGFAGKSAEATLRSHISSVLERLGRWTEAEAEHRKAIELATDLGDLAVATYRGNLGVNLIMQGRLDEAEPELRAKLTLREKHLGPEHPAVAHARFSLGFNFYRQGEYEEAEIEERRALAIWEKVLGPDHAETSLARATLAAVLSEQGRELEAEAEYRTALRDQIAAYGPGHVEVSVTQGDYGMTLLNLGKYEEAEQQLRESLATTERLYPATSPRIARGRARLATLLVRQGHHEEAETHARAALAIFAGRVGQRQLDTAMMHATLGMVLHARGRYQEAVREYQASLALVKDQPAHPDVSRLYGGLGRALLDGGDTDEAVRVLQRAWATFENDLCVRATDRGRLAFDLARALWKRDPATARELAQKARSLMASSPETLVPERAELEALLRRPSAAVRVRQ